MEMESRGRNEGCLGSGAVVVEAMDSIVKKGKGMHGGVEKILVFQQRDSAAAKIAGIGEYGGSLLAVEVVSIDEALPEIIDDSRIYLPATVEADLVLDYLHHPDLSFDLCRLCSRLQVPVVASGKKHRLSGVYTPPT